MGKSTISMAIFNSFLLNYQRVFSADFTDQGAAAFGQSEHRVAKRLALASKSSQPSGVFQQSRNKSREDGDFTLKNLH